MNHYEMICIVDVKLTGGDSARAEELVKMEVLKTGGRLASMQNLGCRKLAYPIQGRSEGLYLLTYFSHPPEGMASLRNNVKLNQAIFRSLIVRTKTQVPIEIGEKEAKHKAPPPPPERIDNGVTTPEDYGDSGSPGEVED